MSALAEKQPGMHPSRAEIRAQLDAMLADRSFTGADRLSRMLRYLVETALERDASELKEYTVGLEVFDRDTSYDPRTDSVVRVHGTRLRTKLAQYYASAGANDRVVIELPKGGYIPEFRYGPSVNPGPRVVALEPRPPVAPVYPKRRIMVFAGFTALVCLIVGVLIARRFLKSEYPVTRTRVTPITAFTGSQEYPSFSPDGSQIVFSWDGGETDATTNLYITTRDGGPTRRLTTGPENDRSPAWSPDGRSIAFIRGEHNVMLVSPLGGSARKVTDTDAKFVSWTPDAESLLISKQQTSGNVLYAVSVQTGQRRPLTSPAENPDDYEPFAISPDSKYLGYARRRSEYANATLYVRRLGGGAVTALTGGSEIKGWTWTPDDDGIVLSMASDGAYRLWRTSPDDGEPSVIPDTENGQFPTVARQPVRAGAPEELIAYEQHNFHVGLNEIDLRPGEPASPARPLLPSTKVDSSPQFSPDGKWIAFTSKRGGFNELWRSDGDGRNPTPLTSLGKEQKSPGSPRWSPDSSRIVFDLRVAGRSNIYVIRADGGPVRRVTNWPADQSRPRYSKDGKWIYFTSTYPSRWSMWKMPADARDIPPERAERLTLQQGFEPEESFDASKIYFFRDTVGHGIGELYSVSKSGGPATKVMDDLVNHGWWSLGKNGIYFAGMPPGKPLDPVPTKDRPIDYFNFATHRVTQLGFIPGPIRPELPDFCVSPDERRILYGQVDASTNLMLIAPAR